MKKIIFPFFLLFIIIFFPLFVSSQSLWDLANEKKDVLRVSTIFTAQNVRDYLSTEDGISEAIRWCKEAGITRVFIESFRGNYTVDREVLENSKIKFENAGIKASGGVTTTRIGKISSTGNQISCYTSDETRKELSRVMAFTASIFDVIMIDDFLFTDCECEECKAACGNRSMSDYRCELLTEVSRDYIIPAAKKINPDVKIIIKYPQWYDDFHRRGYEVLGESELYDIIWVGTETRDSDFSRYDRGWEKTQYEGYFIMRWLTDVGKSKTGGGWFDALGTTPIHYLEQARQTVLADAREMMLFSYGGLITETNTYGRRQGTGIANLETLKKELPGLFELAEIIYQKPIKGVMAAKPANSDPYGNLIDEKAFYPGGGDAYIYDFIGMMGFPLVPVENIDASASAAFFSLQALKDPGFHEKLKVMLSDNKPVMISEALAERLKDIPQNKNLTVLHNIGNLRNLLNYSREELYGIRNKMLAPWNIKFDAPDNVSFYLMGDDIMVIENFNDHQVDASISYDFQGDVEKKLVLPADEKVDYRQSKEKLHIGEIPPRTLVVFQY